MSVIIAKNETAADLPLEQLPVPDNKIPASGQVTLTDFASVGEIQSDDQLLAYITGGDVILNVDATDLSAVESASFLVVLTVATAAGVDAGTSATTSVSPAALAASALASDVTANNAKVSATGPVTTHSDVSSAGSGDIITGAERTKLSGVEAAADVTDASNVAAAGALMVTVVDTKGDLLAATAGAVVAKLPVGSDTQVLTADSGEATGMKWATPPGAYQLITLSFGAKSDSKGKFLIANGKSTDADDSSKPRTRLPIPFTGTLIVLSYQTKEATSSTQMRIHISGSVEETVVLANVNADYGGVETINVGVTQGQYAEVEYDDDDKPGECTMSLILRVPS